MWRRAMDYLGLSGEDMYDDYDMSTEYERPTRTPSTASRGRERNAHSPRDADR